MIFYETYKRRKEGFCFYRINEYLEEIKIFI